MVSLRQIGNEPKYRPRHQNGSMDGSSLQLHRPTLMTPSCPLRSAFFSLTPLPLRAPRLEDYDARLIKQRVTEVAMVGTLHDRLRSLEACALILHGSIRSAAMPKPRGRFCPDPIENCLPESASEAIRAPFGHGSELVPNYFRRDVLSACKSTEATIGAGDVDHLGCPRFSSMCAGKGCSLSASYSC